MQRLVPAVLVLAVLAAGTALLLGDGTDGGGGGDAGDYPVLVLGPDGAELANATVRLGTGATAHDALLAAADAAGLTVEAREDPAYRPCGTYVTAVGGHREGDGPGGSGGWVYEVRRDGDWTRPFVGACGYPLHDGDAVRWRYVTE